LVLSSMKNADIRRAPREGIDEAIRGLGATEEGGEERQLGNEKFQELVMEQLTNLTAEVKKLRQLQARIEVDHGNKLSALLDGYKQDAETLADHTERLKRIESKTESHDIQISELDRTKFNKRKSK
jgi:hypothetical protein